MAATVSPMSMNLTSSEISSGGTVVFGIDPLVAESFEGILFLHGCPLAP